MKTLKQFFGLIIIFILILPAANFGQSLEELIEQGDNYYKKFNNQKALEVYQKADVMYPDNWEILWRISRAYVDIGEHMPASSSEQEKAQLEKYQMAYDYADRAVKLAPGESITYLRRAIANGRIALFKGVFSVAGVVNSVKEDCEKAMQLNTGGREVQSVANYVYARTHAKISEKWAPARAVLGLGWADLDSALVYFDKAVKLKPNYVMFYVDYALALIEDGNKQKAREVLETAIKSPIEDEDDEVRKEEARALLKKLK